MATHKRRRIAIVTIAFLVLMVALVTIYYVAPQRLPGFVVEALDVLLGARK